jgi:7-cyano-7-deazaguanine synthase
MEKTAVVLSSGGMDSTTCIGLAISQGFDVVTVSFNYGQRHSLELEAAQRISDHYGVKQHFLFDVGMFRAIGKSALTDDIDVPVGRNLKEMSEGIPVTYVPARNLVFLSHALGVAETHDAKDIFIGVNALDYSGYPDCRPEFIKQFERTANLATKIGVESGAGLRIRTPLIDMTKADIVRLAIQLNVPLNLTHSCYHPASDGGSCGECDACILRLKGFEEAGLADPIRYSRAA